MYVCAWFHVVEASFFKITFINDRFQIKIRNEVYIAYALMMKNVKMILYDYIYIYIYVRGRVPKSLDNRRSTVT